MHGRRLMNSSESLPVLNLSRRLMLCCGANPQHRPTAALQHHLHALPLHHLQIFLRYVIVCFPIFSSANLHSPSCLARIRTDICLVDMHLYQLSSAYVQLNHGSGWMMTVSEADVSWSMMSIVLHREQLYEALLHRVTELSRLSDICCPLCRVVVELCEAQEMPCRHQSEP